MTPDTVHFWAQVIRHQRALATSFEKWVEKQQDPVVAQREMRELILMFRSVLDSYEWQLQRVSVDYEQNRKVS
jgi:hypothetical protein